MGKWTKQGDTYCPSNGTEGDYFMAKFCDRCIHEKFSHTQNHRDKQCDILSRSMIYDRKDKEFPKEWQYGENDNPLCTAWVKWDWKNDGDPDDPDNPKAPPPPPDPNQLCLPFIIEEIESQNEEKILILET